MDFKHLYNTAPDWTIKVKIMGFYHSSQLQLDVKWTIQNTANFFDVSMGLASENLRLAELLPDFPDLAKTKTRKEALEKIERRRFPRYVIKKER